MQKNIKKNKIDTFCFYLALGFQTEKNFCIVKCIIGVYDVVLKLLRELIGIANFKFIYNDINKSIVVNKKFIFNKNIKKKYVSGFKRS